MIRRFPPQRLAWAAVAAASVLFASWLVVDTLRAVVPIWSPLPWFDEWATVDLFGAWQAGERTLADVLFSQHNEHRILVPRLVFFADDLLFRGGGYLSLAAIFTVQTLHAAIFAAVLVRARGAAPGGWAVAAVILALMFSLRQAENFSSGFQLQFVAVFAGATLSFCLFGLAVARVRAGAGAAWPLAGSFAAALLATFTMANGLAAPFVLVALALLARLRWPVAAACAASAAVLAAVYLHGYEPVEHHSQPADSLRHPVDLARYLAAYLGSAFAAHHVDTAVGFGAFGLAATGAAAVRVLRQRGAHPAALAMFGVMLFVAAAAAVTASGRLAFGAEQALSSRYVTGSVAFWSAQLTYWWIDPPAWPGRRATTAPVRAAVAAVAAVLCLAMVGGQRDAKPQLAVQSFAERESANLLMLGLDDPAAVRRAAWTDEDVERLLPMLKGARLSIFGTADAEGIGRPVTERGAVLPPDACGGEVGGAEADPSLGRDGVRVSGSAWEGQARHLVRRILLADAAGRSAGFGSGAIPGAPRAEWRGFAVAPPGARLTAYGLLPGGLCRIGGVTVLADRGGHPAP